MIKNDAIRIADEIAKAQTTAKLNSQIDGVLFYKAGKNGQYTIVAVKELEIEQGKLGAVITQLVSELGNAQARLQSLETAYKELKENYEQFKALVIDAFRTTEEIIEDNEESGDPL